MSIRPITRLPVLGLLLALTGCVHATDAEAGDHPGEAAFIDSVAGWVAVAIELAGIGIIVIGALIATGFFVRELTRGAAFDAAYHLYRGYLGRA
ncbi:MAG TPA: hypothetical protein VEZ12_22765, partial [Herpetosiphonaceae bacterium]|nr:hypothetical protein [Herpetosiphonaceae bacterium]